MDSNSPKLRIDDNFNVKIQLTRKNILHDVLKYNLQSSIDRKYNKQLQQSLQQNQANQIIQQGVQSLRKQQQQRRFNMIRRRQMLKEQYQRQIRQKQDKKRKEKQHDHVYAKIQKDYQEFSNQRRLYDIQKMFNRKSFQASISDISRGHSNQQSSRHMRIKTQPNDNNPQKYASYRIVAKEPYQNGYYPQNNVHNQHSNKNYKDSIDKLQVNTPLDNRYGGTSIIKTDKKVTFNPETTYKLSYS